MFEDHVARVYNILRPNYYTRALQPVNMSNSEEDVDASYSNNEGALVADFGHFSLGTQSPGRKGPRNAKSLTPTRTRFNCTSMIEGQPVLELVESVKKFDNPCGLYVLFGTTPLPTDDGVEVSNYCQIFYQCQSPQELESTSLKIVVDPLHVLFPSQHIQFTYRSIDASVSNDFQAMQSQFDVYQEIQNDGNLVFRSNLTARVDQMNSLIATEGTTGEGRKKSVFLKLPNNLTCHNRYWQGESYQDRFLLEDGYIKKFHLSTDIEVSELAGWGIDTNRMTNPGNAGSRYWLCWNFAVSGGDGFRLASKSTKKGPTTLADLKLRAASKKSGLAGI